MYTGTKRLSDFVDTIYSRFFVAEHSKILLYTMFYVETNKLFIVLVLFLWFAIHLLVVQGSRLWGYPKEPILLMYSHGWHSGICNTSHMW
jgi:hypothetical protein